MAQKAPQLPEYRYYCDGCTGVAFLSLGTEPASHPGNCQKCGHVIGALKPENFLLLEQNHPSRLGGVIYK